MTKTQTWQTAVAAVRVVVISTSGTTPSTRVQPRAALQSSLQTTVRSLSAVCHNIVTKKSVHPAASCSSNAPQSTNMSGRVEQCYDSSAEFYCNHRVGNTLTCSTSISPTDVCSDVDSVCVCVCVRITRLVMNHVNVWVIYNEVADTASL